MVAQIAVVVPVLNEAQQLPELLAQLEHLSDCQLLLVDGGSSDNTVGLLQQAGLNVVVSERGRARQMNTGAALAEADILLFLHADTQLPANACGEIIRALDNPKAGWGRFDVTITGEHWLLPVIARLMRWRSRLTGIATGDQAIFVRRSLFQQLHGFANIALMEDIELCRRLKKITPPVCLKARVVTSGRRWLSRGVVPTILLMWRLRLLYWLGVNPAHLAKLYR
ncbi:TIGR04283 family arsenosugar biosynthesis glycosyltransferase [Halioxenophilus sp. WMMB6]|uniref:TIGR04283 family arsenosugar biosynthesis glycosyltransferase n=1 Tax=Halioxenophilus sp. WMMB6 TaxID=3073815 RepID=UPI00295E3BFF|nr:TIGR04283 family arsenosugar biosynthesis glycosyltransferase [Halioxenophilus sp. WMMB6]